MKNSSFTSESVCAGHPDKICDQISDAILDEVLRQDKFGRVAIETMVTKNRVIITGEISANAKVNFKKITSDQIKKLGYTNPNLNFTDKSDIEVYVHEQSAEIAQGVDEQGAGDQGMMFGFACDDSPEYMPLPIMLSHGLSRRIDEVREKQILPYLKPDGKTLVTVGYENGKPKKIETIVVAVPHNDSIKLDEVKDNIYSEVVKHVMTHYGFNVSKKKLIVNGTGVWHQSGPAVDAGLTGRKIVVDTYGGYARVGGGAFSGKDPTKVDRSGAYAARFIAKNIVALGLAKKVEVRLAYVIGVKDPVMQEIETYGTQTSSDKVIKDFVDQLIDTSVPGIIKRLDLRRPIYLPTASYGHFGRKQFPWEKIIKNI